MGWIPAVDNSSGTPTGTKIADQSFESVQIAEGQERPYGTVGITNRRAVSAGSLEFRWMSGDWRRFEAKPVGVGQYGDA